MEKSYTPAELEVIARNTANRSVVQPGGVVREPGSDSLVHRRQTSPLKWSGDYGPTRSVIPLACTTAGGGRYTSTLTSVFHLIAPCSSLF